jgi:hypothetical protein
MKKMWHPYQLWEEFHAGMWRRLPLEMEEPYRTLAIKFTEDAYLYGYYMMRVVDCWKYSCEQNLTDMSLNRRAWLGHAACAFAFCCPEYLVRQAWWELTDEQRDAANAKADEAIAVWEERHSDA